MSVIKVCPVCEGNVYRHCDSETCNTLKCSRCKAQGMVDGRYWPLTEKQRRWINLMNTVDELHSDQDND